MSEENVIPFEPSPVCVELKESFMAHLRNRNAAERANYAGKKSFWATDCLKPLNEIYWTWSNEPVTNPIEDEKLSMFRSANAYEAETVEDLVQLDFCMPVTDENAAKYGMTVRSGQFAFNMAREGVPISGKMDGLSVNGVPVEIKTHGFDAVDTKFDKGQPPSDHYLYQLAVYMDFLGSDVGILVHRNRSNGRIFFFQLDLVGELEYECNGFRFSLKDEYLKWAEFYEAYVVPMKEPPLEYYYRPLITKELLDYFDSEAGGEKKIGEAIKGNRILSAHRWRPQYCSWKDLWIQREMAEKGFDNINDMLDYSEDELLQMMTHIGKEARVDKNGKMKLFKAKTPENIAATLPLVIAHLAQVEIAGVTEEEDGGSED